MAEFRAPVGTRDVMPPESARWERLVALFAGQVKRAGYGLVLSPMFEDVGVFERVGEGTDVVRKEMYDFEDKGGRRVALRPEGTASVVRAYVQERPSLPFKAWYAAPNFRYERPQGGRFRQHHQLGVEVLGTDDAHLDVEVVALGWSVCASLGLTRVKLLVNSLGDDVCRPGYMHALRAFLSEARLCDEHTESFRANPLRVLDCKRDTCRAATTLAPRILDYLCEPCATHFSRVRAGLESLGVEYHVQPRLVRGLDYYTRTTFELAATSLRSAQDAVGGGGRYNKLAEALGGPPTPGMGFGLGIERLLLACDAENVFPVPPSNLHVWVIDTAGGTAALELTHELRGAGYSADRSFDGRSMKSQFKSADRSGAQLVAVVGPGELEANRVQLQYLRRTPREETSVHRSEFINYVRKMLS